MSEEVRGIWATVEWSESDVIDSLDAAGIERAFLIASTYSGGTHVMTVSRSA